MSIQHTDASVLSAMERTNLPASRQISIARRLQQENIPILAQLIFGSPGDDLKKWQKTLTDMMEWGIHEEYRPYAYNLLPNAPAAEPSFLRKWGVQTILRYTYVTRRKKSVPMNQFSKTKYIVATNSYTREDWVEMYVFDTFIQALHNGGLTRFLALFLKFTHSVSLHDFYLNLWEGFRTSESRFSDLLKQCASHLSDFVSDRFPESIEEMDIKDLPNSPCYYRPEDFLLFGTLKEIEIFWKDLESLLRPCFAHLDFFESAMNYQQTIVITPHYDSRKGRRMLSELHWPEYYKECLKSCAASQTGGLSRMIPKTKPTGRFHIHFMDKSCGTHFEHSLDWWKFPRESEQWYQAYLDRVIGVDYSKSCRTYLRAVEVT